MNEIDEPIFLEQVARHFGVQVRTVHSWIRRKNNRLKAWKAGGKVYTTQAAIQEFAQPVVRDLPEESTSRPATTQSDIRRRDEALAAFKKKFGKA